MRSQCYQPTTACPGCEKPSVLEMEALQDERTAYLCIGVGGENADPVTTIPKPRHDHADFTMQINPLTLPLSNSFFSFKPISQGHCRKVTSQDEILMASILVISA